MNKVGMFYLSKEIKREIGIYKDFRLQLVTNEDNAKVKYYGYLDKGGNNMPIMQSADDLETLKTKINEYIKAKYV